MNLNVLNVRDVAEAHLCCGCGVCAYLAPDAVQIVDDVEQGRRPHVKPGVSPEAANGAALAACPGLNLAPRFDPSDPGLIRDLIADWGPVLRVWEGYATDPAIRFAGSSGGAATALAAYAVERGGMHGALHTAARADRPLFNETVLSTSRAELLANAGSRYAPASPCDGLALVEAAPGPCVFIGKPCDVAGADAARAVRPELDARLGLTIAVFCAGTPSTRGTLEMLRAMGIADPASVVSVRYRGKGWPGDAVARVVGPDGTEEDRELTYSQSWGEVLQKHRQWRCHLCPDHTGEFADVSVGDPWYRPVLPGEAGRSLVVARTARGAKFVEEAMAAGYLNLEVADPKILPLSQPNLQRVRASVWGRALTCRLMGAAAPRFSNMPLFRLWWGTLSLKDKARSFVATAKRVLRKGLRHRRPVCPHVPPAVDAGGVVASRAVASPPPPADGAIPALAAGS